MKDLFQDKMPELKPIKVDDYWYQEVTVMNKNGLHARPSAHFYEKILLPYSDSIELFFHLNENDTREIKSVFDLMSLGLEMGTHFKVQLKYIGDSSDFESDQSPEEVILSSIHDMFLNIFTD